ncbi:MAG: hypothetical protein F2825_09995, partial [Actinobacteria bacterium]|nr:hypothetical protein [Actinomycetota bacterium]
MRAAPLLALALLCGACDGGADERGGPGAPSPSLSTAPPPAPPSAAPPRDLDVQDPALRDELLAMLAADQAELTGEGLPEGARLPPPQDSSRERRLR